MKILRLIQEAFTTQFALKDVDSPNRFSSLFRNEQQISMALTEYTIHKTFCRASESMAKWILLLRNALHNCTECQDPTEDAIKLWWQAKPKMLLSSPQEQLFKSNSQFYRQFQPHRHLTNTLTPQLWTTAARNGYTHRRGRHTHKRPYILQQQKAKRNVLWANLAL